jgi:hypothetical protein
MTRCSVNVAWNRAPVGRQLNDWSAFFERFAEKDTFTRMSVALDELRLSLPRERG